MSLGAPSANFYLQAGIFAVKRSTCIQWRLFRGGEFAPRKFPKAGATAGVQQCFLQAAKVPVLVPAHMLLDTLRSASVHRLKTSAPTMDKARSRKLLFDVLLQVATLGSLFLALRMAVQCLDPYREQREKVS